MYKVNYVWFDYSDLEHYKTDMPLSAYSIYNTPEMCKFIDDELIHKAIRMVKLYRKYEQKNELYDTDTEYTISQLLSFIGVTAPYVIKSNASGKVLCGVDYNFIINTIKIDNILRSTRPDKRVYAIRKRVNQIFNTITNDKKSPYKYSIYLITDILRRRKDICELVNFTALYFDIPNVAREENKDKTKSHTLVFKPDSISQYAFATWVEALEQNPLK